jgi:predicted small secreted protein
MIRRYFASILAILFALTAAGTLAGCNTIEGAGMDIEQGGKALMNEANEHKR